MIEINTVPNAQTLNVSKVVVTLNSASMFSMQFAVAGFGKWTNAEGVEEYQPNPLVSTLLNVQGETWNNWGSDVDDSTFIGDLALAQLGLTRAPAEETPAESGE